MTKVSYFKLSQESIPSKWGQLALFLLFQFWLLLPTGQLYYVFDVSLNCGLWGWGEGEWWKQLVPSSSYLNYAAFQGAQGEGGRGIGCVLAESQQLSVVGLDSWALLMLCGMLATWNVAKPFPNHILFSASPPSSSFSFGPDLERKGVRGKLHSKTNPYFSNH